MDQNWKQVHLMDQKWNLPSIKIEMNEIFPYFVAVKIIDENENDPQTTEANT